MKRSDNSFDLIRHFAAILVLFSHHFALSGQREPIFLHFETYGFVAVVIFFSISDYLMPDGFTRSGDFVTFITKRCRRIFPGLIMCSFFMCYIIGILFTPQPVLDYLTNPSIFKTMIMFSSFLGRPIPGVFDDFIFNGGAINGSIWTLPVEFLSYIILGVALCYSNTWRSVFILLISSIIITILIQFNRINDLMFYAVPLKYLALFGIAFTSGSLMSMTQKQWFPIRSFDWRIKKVSPHSDMINNRQ